MSRMRVAMVAPGYPPSMGGVERVIDCLSRHLALIDIHVEVFCIDRSIEKRSCTEAHGKNLVVHRFRPDLPSHRFPVSIPLVRVLRRRESEFDVIHAHSFHSSLPLLVATCTDRPYVFSPHFHGVGHSKVATYVHKVYDPLAKVIFSSAAKTICVSQSEAQLLEKWYTSTVDNITVIPTGVQKIDLAEVEPFEHAGTLLMAGGRMESYKQLDKVISTIPCLPPSFSLVITGDGPERPRLESMTRRLGVAGRVRFTGSVPEPLLRRWQKTADVVVTASTQEAFGLQVAEAIYAGSGVVASDLPAHREMLSGLAGWAKLIDVDASPAQWADAIVRCRTRPIPGQVAGNAGLIDWPTVADLTRAVYSEAISGIR